MLFTARPPLPYVKPPIKPRCRNLDNLTLFGDKNILDKFEETPDEFPEYNPPMTKK